MKNRVWARPLGPAGCCKECEFNPPGNGKPSRGPKGDNGRVRPALKMESSACRVGERPCQEARDVDMSYRQ